METGSSDCQDTISADDGRHQLQILRRSSDLGPWKITTFFQMSTFGCETVATEADPEISASVCECKLQPIAINWMSWSNSINKTSREYMQK